MSSLGGPENGTRRSRAGRARPGLLLGVLFAALAVAVSAWVFGRLTMTEEERLSELVDEAREELVDGSPEFLRHFDEDVRYRSGRGLAQLERDFERWQGLGLREIVVPEREIRVEGDTARVRLEVGVFAGFQDLGSYEVHLLLERVDAEWRVVEFRWN